MSTRSAIGYLTPNGNVRAIYCHWDGYVNGGVGETLVTEWQSAYRVAQLVESGHMSQLGIDLKSSVFYGRDRGETDVSPEEFESMYQFSSSYLGECEYVYLYTRDGWLVQTEKRKTFTRVDTYLVAEKNMETTCA
jgi:hypothetical protein|tara:strand:- start:1430 stop:1834 length:405 start_codon:yes stop_codon:yes gene_type:complete